MSYRRITLIAIALLVLSCSRVGAKFDTSTVWRIETPEKLGSGFVYHSTPWATWILTCCHVVDIYTYAAVYKPNSMQVYLGKVVAREPILDCAVIKVSTGRWAALSFGEDVQMGDGLAGFGYVVKGHGLYTEGIKMGAVGWRSMTSSQLGFGASGGPVVSRENGKVCGMLDAVQSPVSAQPGNTYIPVKILKEWLKQVHLYNS